MPCQHEGVLAGQHAQGAYSFVMLLVLLQERSESWPSHRRVLCLSPVDGKQKEEVISLETLPQMLSVIITVFSNKQSECMNLMKVKLFHTHEPSLWLKTDQLYVCISCNQSTGLYLSCTFKYRPSKLAWDLWGIRKGYSFRNRATDTLTQAAVMKSLI